MGGKLELVPAAAGKRLGAAVLDWVAPAAVLAVMFTIGFASITRTQSGGFIIYDTGTLVLLGSIAIGITVVYMLVLLGIEGRTGNTIGNRLMGIRSTDQDGYAPGAGALFLRGLITGAGILLTVVAAVFIVVFKWFEAALWILTPLALIGVAWAVAVVVSSSWDKNGKAPGLARRRSQNPRVRCHGRPKSRDHRRNPGAVQFRAAGPAAGATGCLADSRSLCQPACRHSAGTPEPEPVAAARRTPARRTPAARRVPAKGSRAGRADPAGASPRPDSRPSRLCPSRRSPLSRRRGMRRSPPPGPRTRTTTMTGPRCAGKLSRRR